MSLGLSLFKKSYSFGLGFVKCFDVSAWNFATGTVFKVGIQKVEKHASIFPVPLLHEHFNMR